MDAYQYIQTQLNRYWPENQAPVTKLPVCRMNVPKDTMLPPDAVLVKLPNWANTAGVDGHIAVPSFCTTANADWEKTDWWMAAFHLLNASAEREFEKRSGCIHSYSFKLKNWPKIIWERAWVNRIALFLRLWAAKENGSAPELLMGPLPEPEITITHDVDAVTKTPSTRFKSAVFSAVNALRKLASGELKNCAGEIKSAIKFSLLPANYDRTRQVAEMEMQAGVTSVFNFYGGTGGYLRNPLKTLMDPTYNPAQRRIRENIEFLKQNGFTIGLHQAFDSFDDPEKMLAEKNNLENSTCAGSVEACRQHWLRFCFEKTWTAQQKAGLKTDMTLGFNNHPAFRNSAAIAFSPLDNAGNETGIKALPLVFMDSHFYAYDIACPEKINSGIKYWIDEIKAVHGQASVLWHPRTIDDDYGWQGGFEFLLSQVAKKPAK